MPKLSPDLILQFSDYWLNVAIFQGARLTKLIDAQTAAGLPPWDEEQQRAINEANRLGRDFLVEEAEGYFLIIAVRNALRWLKRAKTVVPSLVSAIDVFLPAAEHVEDVRDMHEHEEEYLAHEGRHQDRYLHKGGLWEGASAHSITVREDDYLIGGRVNLPPLLVALRKLQPEVERARPT